jgi:hypothetical protein
MPPALATASQPAPIYAGFDADQFPGLETMAWLKTNRNLEFTGFYLAPAPSHGDKGWMGQRAALEEQGWGFLPIYVGQELYGPGSHLVTAGQGVIDGGNACDLMAMAGFPQGSRVYLDLEDGAPYVEPRRSYVQRWALTVQARGYHPGIYCSHAIGDDVRVDLIGAGVDAPSMWCFRVTTTRPHAVAQPFAAPDPTGCGVTMADVWQHDQSAVIQADGRALTVDLSSSFYSDPSAP